jgi:guanine deaminase
MRLGNGLADMHGMLARRVNVGIGTDGANCSDNLNVYEAMRLASLVSKTRGPDTERWVTTEQVVTAATEGSARALGFPDRVGRLAPGYKADVVFLDLAHPNWIPLNDPTNQLVHTEDGGAVRHVMIGGRLVVEDRRLTTVDVGALAREAEAARARLARLNAPLRALYERLAPVVGRYCPGLAHMPYHIDRYVGSA